MSYLPVMVGSSPDLLSWHHPINHKNIGIAIHYIGQIPKYKASSLITVINYSLPTSLSRNHMEERYD
jgi:hypothetical protein